MKYWFTKLDITPTSYLLYLLNCGIVIGFLITIYTISQQTVDVATIYKKFFWSLNVPWLMSFMSWGFWGAILIYMLTASTKTTLYIVILFSLVLTLLISLIGHHYWQLSMTQIGMVGNKVFWLTSITVLCVNLYQKRQTSESQHLVTTLLICIFLPLLIFISQLFIFLSAKLYPFTNDYLLYAIDHTFGLNISFLIGQLFTQLPNAVQLLCIIIYTSLPIVWACTYIKCHYINRHLAIQFVIEFLTIGTLGTLLYTLIPACGTFCAFGDAWPWHPLPTTTLLPSLISLPIDNFPRNCLPSLHTAWILCLYRYCQPSRAITKFFIGLWMLLGFIAVVSIGHHYFIDMVMGVIFAGFVQALCANFLPFFDKQRYAALLVSLSLYVMWMVLIKLGLGFLQTSFFIPWFLAISAITVVSWYSIQLNKIQKNKFTCLSPSPVQSLNC
jgi:hypothetical protein